MSNRRVTPEQTRDTQKRFCVIQLAQQCLSIPLEELEAVTGVREVRASLLRLLPRQLEPWQI